jgi:serine/threonine protein kinase
VGYFLLTGTPPFEGKSVIEICMHHSRTPPQKPSERLRRPVSADLEAVLLKGLAKNPHDRYQTAREFAAALATCVSAADWNSRKADLWWQSITVGVKSAVSSGTTGINEAQTVVLAALSGDGTM